MTKIAKFSTRPQQTVHSRSEFFSNWIPNRARNV
jgi:hypothetical protein